MKTRFAPAVRTSPLTGIRSDDETALTAQRLLLEYHTEWAALQERIGYNEQDASRIDQRTGDRLVGSLRALQALLEEVIR